ncbi:MAG: hypothetical protein M1832_002163 [Thelocarpon impressellum]|nr:MAG: hypothetical protein M1832_002163 [Thelocarpon impressellum]
MVNPLIIVSIVIAVIAAALAGIWFGGLADDILAPIAKYIFFAKAKAQKKALQAQGKKAGVDFFESQLSGNKQAGGIAQEGLSALKNL